MNGVFGQAMVSVNKNKLSAEQKSIDAMVVIIPVCCINSTACYVPCTRRSVINGNIKIHNTQKRFYACSSMQLFTQNVSVCSCSCFVFVFIFAFALCYSTNRPTTKNAPRIFGTLHMLFIFIAFLVVSMRLCDERDMGNKGR